MRFEIIKDKKVVCIAGRSDLDFLSATCIGSKKGAPYLRVTGISTHKSGESEHLTWIDESVNLGMKYGILITENRTHSDILRKDSANSVNIQKRINESLKKIKNEKKTQQYLKNNYPDLYFGIEINNEDTINVSIDDYDQILFQLSWSKTKECVKLKVVSRSENHEQIWINRSLFVNDRIFLLAQGHKGRA